MFLFVPILISCTTVNRFEGDGVGAGLTVNEIFDNERRTAEYNLRRSVLFLFARNN